MSVSRVDYAMDILIPDFELVPDNFVMHSHANRADFEELDTRHTNGRSGRVTSVTVGKMPNRQVIVYDKTLEIRSKTGKRHWPEIWNEERARRGLPSIDFRDPNAGRVWRVELRAGKRHLKDRWRIDTWQSLDNAIGDVMRNTAEAVRYSSPTPDTNRSRWPNDPIWDVVQNAIDADLHEMKSGITPDRVREIVREEHIELLMSQVIGVSATLAFLQGHSSKDRSAIADTIRDEIAAYQRSHPDQYATKVRRASERYAFIGE